MYNEYGSKELEADVNEDRNLGEERAARPCPAEQHVHEVTGSTMVSAERCKTLHNHRFATVSDEAIYSMGSHVHRVKFKTDSYEGHYHEFYGTSSRAIPVGDGRHVHFIKNITSPSDNHVHCFRVAFLIEDPIGD